MKKYCSKIQLIILSLIISVITTCQVFAQVPQKICHQIVIRDTEGELIKNTQVGIRISIIEGELPGTTVYQKIQTPFTSKYGVVTLEIGGEVGFDAIEWGSDIHHIKTETDPAGGTNYTISGTCQILSVPYANFVGKAQSVNGRYCYPDKDDDGYGDEYSPLWIPEGVNVPTGFILNGEDCDDLDQSVHPGATEICGDGIDQDCDGFIDEDC
jgi:hypothetical protein